MADMLTRLGSAADMAHHPRIKVTDIESRLGTRYTIDTIAALTRRFPVWISSG